MKMKFDVRDAAEIVSVHIDQISALVEASESKVRQCMMLNKSTNATSELFQQDLYRVQTMLSMTLGTLYDMAKEQEQIINALYRFPINEGAEVSR